MGGTERELEGEGEKEKGWEIESDAIRIVRFDRQCY